MADVNIGQLASTLWDKLVSKKPEDTIFRSRALFYALGEKGFREEIPGGRYIEVPLEVAENTTNEAIAETGTLNTTRIDTFDAAQYSIAIVAGTVVFSELEKLRAREGKIDVVAEKLENEKDSHINTLNKMFWGSGGGLNPDGIQKVISTTPTTGTVGGINRATWSLWRNQQASGAQTSSAFDNLRAKMRNIYNSCSLGGTEKAPTFAITTQTVFEGYESLLVANERYNKDGGQRGGDLGFSNNALQFKGVDLFYDEEAASGNLYFGNPKFVKVAYLKGGWMKFDNEPIEPGNQLIGVQRLRTYCQMIATNPRHLGVVSAIS